MKGPFLYIEPGMDGFDGVYYPIGHDPTWRTVLDHIKSNIDGQYNNEDSLVGIELMIKIVTECPDDVDWESGLG